MRLHQRANPADQKTITTVNQIYMSRPLRVRLRVVPHFSSGIVGRAKRECRLFSRGVIFTRARVSLALLSLRKNGGLLVVYLRVKHAAKITFAQYKFRTFQSIICPAVKNNSIGISSILAWGESRVGLPPPFIVINVILRKQIGMSRSFSQIGRASCRERV